MNSAPAATASRPSGSAPRAVFSPVFHSARRHWLAGIAIALAGAAIARLLAPAVFDEPRLRSLAVLFGELVALTGLFVIVLGIRRRIRDASAERHE